MARKKKTVETTEPVLVGAQTKSQSAWSTWGTEVSPDGMTTRILIKPGIVFEVLEAMPEHLVIKHPGTGARVTVERHLMVVS